MTDQEQFEREEQFFNDPVVIAVMGTLFSLTPSPHHVPSPGDPDQIYRVAHYALFARCDDLFGTNWEEA